MIKMISREQQEQFELKNLAFYATKSINSKGRKIKIKEHTFRTSFQRDIDRIVHSKSFRRLEYKTQVFVNHEGDHPRTRLTHTIEVVQISTTIARALGLNEDLTRAIALGHDLGHTPFGHSGEIELNAILLEEGLNGFKHNDHSIRVVDELEKKYEEYDGLNLTWEVREGILKHTLIRKGVYPDLLPEILSTLEGQVVAIADEIAQDSHDLDDGLREEIISFSQLKKLSIFNKLEISEKINSDFFIKKLIDFLVTDIINFSLFNFNKEIFIIDFNLEIKKSEQELRSFLLEYIYNNYRIKRMDAKARKFIRDLYTSYKKDPLQLPDEVFRKCSFQNVNIRILNEQELEKIKNSLEFKKSLTDYISGMTDRYAQDEYIKLFIPYERV
ncbi:MAG: dGTP triphosphohydrolase [bacterium]